jgi:chromosome segregation ATPase
MRLWPFVWRSEHEDTLVRYKSILAAAAASQNWYREQTARNMQLVRDRNEATALLTSQKVWLAKEKSQLEDEVATLRDEARQASEWRAGYVAKTTETIASMGEKMIDMDADYTEAIDRVMELSGQVDAANTQIASLTEKLELEARAASYNGDCAGSFREDLEKTKGELAEAKAAIENLEAALSIANGTIGDMIREVECLTDEVEWKSERIIEKNQELIEKNQELIEKNHKIHQLSIDLDSWKQDAAFEKSQAQIARDHSSFLASEIDNWVKIAGAAQKREAELTAHLDEVNHDRDLKDSCIANLGEQRAIIRLVEELAARHGMKVVEEDRDDGRYELGCV